MIIKLEQRVGILETGSKQAGCQLDFMPASSYSLARKKATGEEDIGGLGRNTVA